MDAGCNGVFYLPDIIPKHVHVMSNNWQSSALLSTRVAEPRYTKLLSSCSFGLNLTSSSGFSRGSNLNPKICRMCLLRIF